MGGIPFSVYVRTPSSLFSGVSIQIRARRVPRGALPDRPRVPDELTAAHHLFPSLTLPIALPLNCNLRSHGLRKNNSNSLLTVSNKRGRNCACPTQHKLKFAKTPIMHLSTLAWPRALRSSCQHCPRHSRLP